MDIVVPELDLLRVSGRSRLSNSSSVDTSPQLLHGEMGLGTSKPRTEPLPLTRKSRLAAKRSLRETSDFRSGSDSGSGPGRTENVGVQESLTLERYVGGGRTFCCYGL